MDPFQMMAMEQAIKDAKSVEPQYIEVCHIMARELKHYFDALVEQGFTQGQALEIIKAHGCIPGGMK